MGAAAGAYMRPEDAAALQAAGGGRVGAAPPASPGAAEVLRQLRAEDEEGGEVVAGYAEHGTASPSRPAAAPADARPVPLNVVGSTHQPAAATQRLLRDVGGLPALRAMTGVFYRRCFADAFVDRFLRDHADPHGERFATWLAEKMGDPARPWAADRAARSTCPAQVGGGYEVLVHDRSSAHQAAWLSPKRPESEMGRHFKLDDCRAWMRLMFWSARDCGLMDHPQFGEWYVRFIGHFVRVYERSAPPFAREAARWSADPANLDRYRAAGRRMTDVIGVSYSDALAQLPAAERRDAGWPYA